MEITVQIQPGLAPTDRHVIEDAVMAALGDDVAFMGGGTFLGGDGASDFSLGVSADRDPDEVAGKCRAALGAFSFSLPTTIRLTVGDQSQEITNSPADAPPTTPSATPET